MRKRAGKAPLITVLSPIYGCRDCLKDLAQRVSDTFEASPFEWELLLVDDRGPSEPWDVICELAAVEPRIRGIRLARNHGQHLAIWAGLEAAKGEWVAIVDCDLQDDPTVIPELYYEARAKQVEAVVVDRGTWSDSRFRRLASRSFYRVMAFFSGFHIEKIGNFGIYSRRMVDALVMFREQEVFLPIMVALTGLKISYYEVNRSERPEGKSSYSLLTLFRLAAGIIIRFSDRPLKISIVTGAAFSVLSAMISVFLLVAWLLGNFTVPGWTSTILSLWFLTGLIMATLGIHGFYLAQVFAEVKARPRVIVEATTMDEIADQDDRERII